MATFGSVCARCELPFDASEQVVNTAGGELWHTDCFVCAQCFQPFPDGVFYEFDGRKFCEHDFQVLYAPCCEKCNEFIIGRVIRALSANWHADCFRCHMCDQQLADAGFVKHQHHQALCYQCSDRLQLSRQQGHICFKCHGEIDGEPLRYRGELYHPYHFNCHVCNVELDFRARELKSRPGMTSDELTGDSNELYCLRCYDKKGVPVCAACYRPIEERIVKGLGKNWHAEHFTCAQCEKPIGCSTDYFEREGRSYCRRDFQLLFGHRCFGCGGVSPIGNTIHSLGKTWCGHHLACFHCDQPLMQKSKFLDIDMKPICIRCYERLPNEFKRRLEQLDTRERLR